MNLTVLITRLLRYPQGYRAHGSRPESALIPADSPDGMERRVTVPLVLVLVAGHMLIRSLPGPV